MKISVISILAGSLLALSCFTGQKNDDHAGHAHEAVASAKQMYTCPMHPQVIQHEPGSCPVCGMDLVKVNAAQAQGNELMLTDTQIKLANITSQKVSTKSIGQTRVFNARLTENEELTQVISSRAGGRVEKLFVKETGRAIRAGEPLYELYSEALLTLQREYLLAKEQYETLGKSEPRYASFLKAAEKKLLLYGLTPKQIEGLNKTHTVQPRITFVAPAGGVVSEISVNEGQYIAEGALLYRIINISKLWVEAELYPGESNLVREGDLVQVLVSGFESSPATAEVTFFQPEFRANSQIVVMRAEINNASNYFKPGMQAQVLVTQSGNPVIAIPVDAVIRDGTGTHVYVETDQNTFVSRMVTTGMEDFDQVEIKEGLHEGERIAVTGAYLLYSEIVLKKGTDPMAGHSH